MKKSETDHTAARACVVLLLCNIEGCRPCRDADKSVRLEKPDKYRRKSGTRCTVLGLQHM